MARTHSLTHAAFILLIGWCMLLVSIQDAGLAQDGPPGTVSLLRLWSAEFHDNMTVSLVPAFATSISGRPRDFLGKYADSTLQGYIFSPDSKTPPPAGTVPLHERFSPSRTDSYTAIWRGPGRAEDAPFSPDYSAPVLLGYIYDPSLPQPEGTVPLIRWWSPSRKDNHTTTMPAWRGAAGEWREPDYSDPRLEGYVFPPLGMEPASQPPPAALRDVTFTLDRVVVHDDCDDISPGDWFIGIAAVNPGNPSHIQRARFPSSGNARNVSTGETLSIGTSITLSSVPVTNSIRFVIEAMDCDANGQLSWALLFPFSLFSTVDRDGLSPTGLGSTLCHNEEEFWEISGNDDYVGNADRLVTPEEWQSGRTFTLSAPSRGSDCERAVSGIGDPGGPPNYTATVTVRAR